MKLLILILLSCASASFLRLHGEAARQRLLKSITLRQQKTHTRGAFGCKECVDFMAANLNNLLNIILQVGIEGTCSDVCKKLPSSLEQVACDLLCIVSGIKDFIKVLNQDDLDPVYICAALKACKNNTCTGSCTEVVSAVVNPNSAPLRSKFTLSASVKALKDTGVGVTLFSFPCDNKNCQNPTTEFAIVNDGMTAGSVVISSVEINTAEDDWSYPVGKTLPVTVYSCGSDCVNEHGTIFSAAYTNFTITSSLSK